MVYNRLEVDEKLFLRPLCCDVSFWIKDKAVFDMLDLVDVVLCSSEYSCVCVMYPELDTEDSSPVSLFRHKLQFRNSCINTQ